MQLKTNHTLFNSEETKVGKTKVEKTMRQLLSTYVFAVLLISIAVSLKVQAATPGLPFTEDFSDTNLQDSTQTTAKWDTKAEQLTFGAWQHQFGVLQSGDTAGISDDENDTAALALGDVDGDGDLDVVAGNVSDQMNRLVLNNGSADPFNGVTGSNISADVNNTTALALGDVDGDGDLDIVVGNENETNRLILNNGSDTPFVSAIPSNVSEDEHRTHALALGDMDGDGDLDVIVGNLNETNRLVLNNGSVNPFTGVAGSDINDDSSSTVALALGDMDGDGELDVITGNQNETNRLALNNGSDAPFNDVVSSNISTDADSTEALMSAGDRPRLNTQMVA